ncbi:MAG: BON domain-containing protein [Gammaproteobacteria bacterium]|nr:BON domain-containing protein [Gammaproteobacteria bacterium]
MHGALPILTAIALSLSLPVMAAESQPTHPTEMRSDASATDSHADADNTERNERDRDGKTLTPMDQSSKASDVDLTQKIRSALMEDDNLGTNAKNVKVIAVDGKVTLRGPVADAAERAKVVKIASQSASPAAVVDELEVESK